jgi:hypothetical protein
MEQTMWQLLKSEFSYNRIAFLGVLAFVIPICMLESFLEDLPSFYIIFPMLWFGMFWIMIRNKEVRECYLVHVPLSRCKLGLARMLMIVLPALIIVACYESIHFIFRFRGSANYPVSNKNLVVYFAIVIFIFSAYFIIRDLTLFFLRSNRFFKLTKERSKILLILVTFALNLLGVFAFIARPVIIGKIFEFFIHSNPFADVNNVIKFSAICLTLAILSVASYNRRKAYLE